MELNNQVLGNLNTDYEELKRLNGQNPHPGSGPVNNIKAAKEQQEELRDFIKKHSRLF